MSFNFIYYARICAESIAAGERAGNHCISEEQLHQTDTKTTGSTTGCGNWQRKIAQQTWCEGHCLERNRVFTYESIIQNWWRGAWNLVLFCQNCDMVFFFQMRALIKLQSYTVYWVGMKGHQTNWKIKIIFTLAIFRHLRWLSELGDQWSGGGQGENTVRFQRLQQDRETNLAMRWKLARMSCYLLHRCNTHNHWARWADPSEREPNDRLIGWTAAMWRYESNKVAWADCSHSWLTALGFTQHMPEKPCSMQDIQNRSDKIDTFIIWIKKVVPSRKVTVKLMSMPPEKAIKEVNQSAY